MNHMLNSNFNSFLNILKPATRCGTFIRIAEYIRMAIATSRSIRRISLVVRGLIFDKVPTTVVSGSVEEVAFYGSPPGSG